MKTIIGFVVIITAFFTTAGDTPEQPNIFYTGEVMTQEDVQWLNESIETQRAYEEEKMREYDKLLQESLKQK